jgi:hypothetical protein
MGRAARVGGLATQTGDATALGTAHAGKSSFAGSHGNFNQNFLNIISASTAFSLNGQG